MDGYASGGAAMILAGMKVTVPAGLPKAILADPAVLLTGYEFIKIDDYREFPRIADQLMERMTKE